MEEGTDAEEERSEEGAEGNSDTDSMVKIAGREEGEENEDDKEEMEEVTMVGELKRGEKEVEMVEDVVVEKDEKKVDGAVGLTGATDLRTAKVKADRKA